MVGQMEGISMAGRVLMCSGCHVTAPGGDYIFHGRETSGALGSGSATLTRRAFGALAGVSALFILMPWGVRAAHAQTLPGALVSSDWLRTKLGSPDLVVVELRSAAGGPFAGAHIPGALVSPYPGRWQVDRAGIPWSRPAPEDVAALLGGLEIGPGKRVVLVPMGNDATELGAATWPYWLVRYSGHAGVALLDGGLNAWLADQTNPRDAEARQAQPVAFTTVTDESILISTADVAGRLHGTTVILDARSPDQYAGTSVSSLVVRAGHIPGAINLPFFAVYDSGSNRLKPVDDLRAIAEQLVPNREVEIIVYCNTGHWSSIVWFALHEVLGYRTARLYEDSMAGWSREPTLPLTLGSAP